METSVYQPVVTGQDPRSFESFTIIRAEINKLNHPLHPVIDWKLLQHHAITLFTENGVDLQSVVYYSMARTQLNEWQGFAEGCELLAVLIVSEWEIFWPPKAPARARNEIIDWFAARVGTLVRSLPKSNACLRDIFRAEYAINRICEKLSVIDEANITLLQSLHFHLKETIRHIQPNDNSSAGNNVPPQGKAPAAAAPEAKKPEDKKPEDKKPEAEKKVPPPWGEAKDYALQMGGFAFPLHVVGYNWMQGCADGAQRLKRRIRQIAASYKPAGTEGVTQSWITREPVSQVIVITHGTGGLVMKALLAGAPPETDGKVPPIEGGGAPEKVPPSSNSFAQADTTKREEAAQVDEASQAPQVIIKEEPNPFTGGLELLKAIHVGLPENGTPETYAWFRAGMQTPVKADSKSDMAVAYVTNQVLGANAMEITAVLSYSQCALETLPNNAYPKKWLCWQPASIEGGKPTELVPLKINEDVYKEYSLATTWYKAINKDMLEADGLLVSDIFNEVQFYLNKTSAFHLSVTNKGLDKAKILLGKSSKPSTRDKIAWQAQHYAIPLPPAESWTLYGKTIPTDNPLVRSINSIFKTNLLSSLADSGEGTICLTSPQMSTDILPVEFVLQKGTSEGDGQVTPEAVKGAEVVACSEYHSDILQDEAIRTAVNTAIQLATWEYKAEQSK